MKKRNLLTLVLALALVVALAVGGTLAYFTDSDDAGNTFTMGKVDINLDESENGTDWVEDGIEYGPILPGDTKTKIARVTVKDGSEDCYVMVSVQITTPAGSTLDDDNIEALYKAVNDQIDKTKWDVKEVTVDGVKTLRCAYLGNGDHIAHANDKLILFEKIEIPAEFKNNTAGQNFSVKLNAYAIQSANITYNDNIWNGNFEEVPEPQN